MSFPTQPPALDGVVHIDVQVDRHRWHVATAGEESAPPMVLLHGWPQHWWMWRKVIPELARTHRVYAPDLRGFGWSDAPHGTYSKMGLAADVERLLDVLEIETCTLVGHDWGGFTAWLTAIRAPDRLERLVVLSMIHPWFKPELDLRALALSMYIPVLAAPVLGTSVQRFAPIALRTILRRAVSRDHVWDEEDLALYAEAWQRPDHASAASAVYRTFLTRELPALLRGGYAKRRVELPVVTATGELDPVITPDRMAGAEAHVPDLSSTIIEGAGHFLPEERPQRVLDLILSR